MANEKELPTKHTKHANEAESLGESFRAFCVFSGQPYKRTCASDA